MSQAEVLEYLKRHKGQKYTAKYLGEKLGVNRSTISTKLNKLVKWRFIKAKYTFKNQVYYYY